MKKTPFWLARQLQGQSQLEVAAIADIHVSVLSQIERGWRIPTPDQIKKLKRALPKLEQAEVLTGEK